MVVGHRKSLFVLVAHAVKMYSWESPNLVREIPTEDVLRGFSEQRSEACLEPVDWGSGQIGNDIYDQTQANFVCNSQKVIENVD